MRAVWCALLSVVIACGGRTGLDLGSDSDRNAVDGSMRDATVADASMRDATMMDASTDAAALDGASIGDATVGDASSPDACDPTDCSAEPLRFEQEAYLKAGDPVPVQFFGQQVAMSGDTLVVGANWNGVWPWGGAVFVFVRRSGTWVQQAKLIATSVDPGDQFGGSVAIDGDTLVVGADNESSNARGINGDESDNSAYGSGAAYVFVRRSGTWRQQAFLKASNTGGGDGFGTSVSISQDTVVVGAPMEDANVTGVDGNQSDDGAIYSGAAYVFGRSGETWTQRAYLKASNTGAGDRFGASVTVSGNTLAVSATNEASSATGVDGDQTDDSAEGSGAVYVFTRVNDRWQQQEYLKARNSGARDWFGHGLALAGDTLVVGAYGESSDATGINGEQLNENAADSGAAYVFVRRGSTWSQQAYLKASNAVVGDSFGSSVAISGELVLIGASNQPGDMEGLNGGPPDRAPQWSGAAYVFRRSGSSWSEAAFLKASNVDYGDNFGTSVAISGDVFAVSASSEGSTASGINGDQFNNDCSYCGAVYAFRVIR